MKINEVIVNKKSESEEIDEDDWTRIEQGSITSGKDVVLSNNGEQAVRDLKLSDQEVELLKAVALGWADMSDLGNLEQDIYNSWVENNPSATHGGDDDPSDEIMNELESWFEDKHPDEARFDAEFKASSDRIARDAIDDEKTLTPFKYSKGEKITDWADPETTAAAKRDTKKVQRTGTHANRKWAVGEEREDDAPSTRTSGFTKSAGSDLQGLIKQEPANAKELKGKKRALKFKLPQTIKMPYDDDEEHVNTLMGSEEGAPTIDDLARILKLAGVKSEAAGKAKPHTDLTTADPDDFSKGGVFDPKPSFGDIEGISKPTPNVDTFSSKFHKSPDWKNVDVTPKKHKNTDPDR